MNTSLLQGNEPDAGFSLLGDASIMPDAPLSTTATTSALSSSNRIIKPHANKTYQNPSSSSPYSTPLTLLPPTPTTNAVPHLPSSHQQSDIFPPSLHINATPGLASNAAFVDNYSTTTTKFNMNNMIASTHAPNRTHQVMPMTWNGKGGVDVSYNYGQSSPFTTTTPQTSTAAGASSSSRPPSSTTPATNVNTSVSFIVPDGGVVSRAKKCNTQDENFNLSHIPYCVKQTVTGIAHDMKEWPGITSKEAGGSGWFRKIQYILSKNDRHVYLAVLVIGVLIFALALRGMLVYRYNKRINCVT